MIVYHGSTMPVEEPDVLHSYHALDFGKGFYVTTRREQAEHWAQRKAAFVENGKGIVNLYEMAEDVSDFKVKTFPDDLNEWIDFVCDCRDGKMDYLAYDLIVGKVANDKVFRVVDMYHTGIWDRERALKEIRAYPNYDQLAFISQRAIDQLLRYQGSLEV